MGLCQSDEHLKNYDKDKQKKKQKKKVIGVEKKKTIGNHSSIFNNQNEKEIIQKSVFSEIRKIFKKQFEINIIYKASEYHFSATKFHQKAHGSKNTILFVKTTDNRIFGGFTVCEWKNEAMYQYQADPCQRSFIFCLLIEPINSQNAEKQIKCSKIQCRIFKLNKKQKAIMNHSTSGPIFGEGHDIFINDKCNINQSWCNLGMSYECSFNYGSVKANNLMAGSSKFLISEYQLWSIVFFESKQK